MGGNEESNKPSILHDRPPSPSPTPTQPLLAKPFLSPAHTDEPSTSEFDQNHYTQISYNYGPRSFKDLPFLVLFLLFVLSTFAFGIFASVHRNPNHSRVSYYVYDSTFTSCVEAGGYQAVGFLGDFISLQSSNSVLLQSLIWTFVITLILSVPFVLFVLYLLRHYTKQIVYAALPFFIIVPIFINIYWFVACTVSPKCSDVLPLAYRILVLVFVFLIIGVIVWIFVVNWHRIELTIKIIGVSANALSRNLSLFGVLPSLTLGLFIFYAPIIVFLVLARQNGKIVPREKNGEVYCVWKEGAWVPAYYALAVLTMLWSAAAMVEACAYVISGTIAQWYFAKDDSSPKRSIRSSLRNAFGPSSGTVCMSGLLIGVVRLVRSAVDNARQENASGIVNLVLQSCVNSLLAAIDYLNKFTINFAAITGEAYCISAKMTYELLKRNLLSAVFVETVSTRILAGITFVVSALYTIVVCAILKGLVHLGADSYFVAAMAWALLILILGFFMNVLDNVIDCIYVCYAIDRDRGEVCKQEVHEVYVHLPISRDHRSAFGARTPLLV